uniref:Transmembrane protein n=1 Tax=Macrostomum lignano TaxID=282301 RepID=A0A1I8FR27_9PLAT
RFRRLVRLVRLSGRAFGCCRLGPASVVGLVRLLVGLSGFWSGLSGFWSGLSGFWSGLSGFWSGLSGFWSGLSGFGRACPASGRVCPASGRACPASGVPVCLPLSALPSNRAVMNGRHQQAARCFRRLPQATRPGATSSACPRRANAVFRASHGSDHLSTPCEKPPSLRCAADVAPALAATFGQTARICRLFTRQAVGQLAEVALGGVAAPMETLLATVASSNFVRRGGGEPAGLPYGSSWRSETPSERARPQQTAQTRQRQNRHRQGSGHRHACLLGLPLDGASASSGSGIQRRTVELFSPDGSLSLVREVRPSPIGSPTQQLQVATRGHPARPAGPADGPSLRADGSGVYRDFLLTYPAFYQSGLPVAKRLLGAAGNQEEPERRTSSATGCSWPGLAVTLTISPPSRSSSGCCCGSTVLGAGRGGRREERRLLGSPVAPDRWERGDRVGAGEIASCRSPEPPAGRSGRHRRQLCPTKLELDDDIDQVDAGLQLRLRECHRLNWRARQLRLHAVLKLPTSLSRRVRAFGCCRDLLPEETAAAVNDRDGQRRRLKLRGSLAFGQWGSAGWMVSVSPGL